MKARKIRPDQQATSAIASAIIIPGAFIEFSPFYPYNIAPKAVIVKGYFVKRLSGDHGQVSFVDDLDLAASPAD